MRVKKYDEFLNELFEYPKLKAPLVPDAVEFLKDMEGVITVRTKDEYEKVTGEQKYFSASHSHCFYTQAEYEKWSKKGSKYDDKNSEESDILKNVGDLVAVWDNKNKVGYVLPQTNQHAPKRSASVTR